MDNKEKNKEIDIVATGTTKTFEKAKNDDASLFSFAGGEECICELTRNASTECAAAMRRIKWRTHRNTRFIVYCMFFVILFIFAVYYFLSKTYYIAALTGMVGAFMLYIVLRGESFFVTGMSFDEENADGAVLSVKFCADNVYVFDGKALVTVDYKQITQYKPTSRYLFFKLKGVKQYPDGLLLLNDQVDAEQLEQITKKLITDK